jgi:regulatory protein
MPSAYQRALRRLSRRDHSEQEIRRALAGKGHEELEIEEAVARLRRERALDDFGFAARFARSRMVWAGLGRNRIRRDLGARGVSRTATEAALREAASEVSEGEVLERAARRYWALHATVEPQRRIQKLWAFLLRRGFPAGLVQERLKGLWPRWTDCLDGLEPAGEREMEEHRRDS